MGTNDESTSESPNRRQYSCIPALGAAIDEAGNLTNRGGQLLLREMLVDYCAAKGLNIRIPPLGKPSPAENPA